MYSCRILAVGVLCLVALTWAKKGCHCPQVMCASIDGCPHNHCCDPPVEEHQICPHGRCRPGFSCKNGVCVRTIRTIS